MLQCQMEKERLDIAGRKEHVLICRHSCRDIEARAGKITWQETPRKSVDPAATQAVMLGRTCTHSHLGNQGLEKQGCAIMRSAAAFRWTEFGKYKTVRRASRGKTVSPEFNLSVVAISKYR